MKQKKGYDLTSNLLDLANSEHPPPPTSVGDVMTSNVVTLSPYHTFQEAVGLMANRPFRHFLVVEKDGKLAGVISDRDLLRALNRKPDWSKTIVGEVMTRETVTVQPKTSLSDAVGKMLEHRINCLPVVDERGKVCGILTSTDLLVTFQRIQVHLERVTK